MENKASVGVLGGRNGFERTAKDKAMQQEFCPCGTAETYCGNKEVGVLTADDYGQRSQKDIVLQKMFNPYYKSVNFGKEDFARITDDPYNPLSSKVKYVPIQ